MTTRLTRKQFWPMAKAPATKPRKNIEDGIQMDFMRWADEHAVLASRLHGNLFIRIPNGGRRSRWAGQRSVLMGEKKGVPDLLLPLMRGGYGALWIELKAPKGVTSLEQREWIATLRSLGYACCVCYSLDEAIKQTERYLMLDAKWGNDSVWRLVGAILSR